MEATIWIYLFVAIGVNAGFSAIVAYVAKQKDRSAAGFFWLSFFLSFLVGILVVLAIPKSEDKIIASSNSSFSTTSSGEQLVKCPFCAEWVKSEAKVCKYCKSDIEDAIAKIKIHEKQELEQEIFARSEAEKLELSQKAIVEEQSREKRKQLFASKPFKIFAPITIILVGLIGYLLISPSIKGLNYSAQLDEKARQSDLAIEDWSKAISICENEYPEEASVSGVKLSSDGNRITVENTDDSTLSFVSCILKITVDSTYTLGDYWKRLQNTNRDIGEENVSVIVQEGIDQDHTGRLTISKR